MKKYFIGMLAVVVLLSGCGTNQMVSGDPGTVAAGALVGGNVGGAIGGLIGDSNRGWGGGYRGSAIGTIIGTIAGAAIANAATTPKQAPASSYKYSSEPNESQSAYSYSQPTEEIESTYSSAVAGLRIRNIQFEDETNDQVIRSNENSRMIFEIMNESGRTAYNVVPVVQETTGMKYIYISSSVMIEQITPGNGVRYTANIHAGKRLKTGRIVLRISITDEMGQEYDYQEFSLPTQR